MSIGLPLFKIKLVKHIEVSKKRFHFINWFCLLLMVLGKLPSGKFPPIKLPPGESPRKIPTQKIPTWKIPTYVFKYSHQRFLIFFINVNRYHCCWSSLIIGHYYNLPFGSKCSYLWSFSWGIWCYSVQSN